MTTGVSTYPISELVEVQARWRLQGVHLVWLGPNSFTIAHTDAERRAVERGGPSLEECELHQWLTRTYEEGRVPAHFGIFVATAGTDRPFAFTKLNAYRPA